MKVNIQNYQAIKKADLLFDPGITAIVGESNNGKSSIIRAIEAAINNKGGDSFINYDADSCLVTIEDNNSKVIWSKHKKAGKSFYDINGTILSKIGQKQIDEVAEALNTPEISVNNDKFRLNFWKQLDFPFLVGRTSYQLFDFISNSKDQELISGAQEKAVKEMKGIKAEIDDTNSKINIKTEDINKAIKEVESLQSVADFDIKRLEKLLWFQESLKEKLDTYSKATEALEEKKERLRSFNKEFKALTKIIQSLDNNTDIIKDYNDMANSLDRLEEDFTRLNNISKEHIEKEKLLKSNEEKLLKIITKYEKLEATGSKLSTLLESYGKNNRMHSTILDYIEDNKKDLKEAVAKLNEFEICPLCGGDMKNHQEDHL